MALFPLRVARCARPTASTLPSTKVKRREALFNPRLRCSIRARLLALSQSEFCRVHLILLLAPFS